VEWVDWEGKKVETGLGVTVNDLAGRDLDPVVQGVQLGNPADLLFRDPSSFRAGELHNHYEQWVRFGTQQKEVLGWIRNKVSIFPFFSEFVGSFKGELYHSSRPPSRQFKNNSSCQAFVEFVRATLLERLKTGAVSLVGRVGKCVPPHLVLPLTVEPTKPRLCHDARFLNLWMTDKPFSLDKLSDVPRYVGQNHYQSILDDKSGYDHLFLTPESRSFFGIEWGSFIIRYPLAGKFRHLCTTQPPWSRRTGFVP